MNQHLCKEALEGKINSSDILEWLLIGENFDFMQD